MLANICSAGEKKTKKKNLQGSNPGTKGMGYTIRIIAVKWLIGDVLPDLQHSKQNTIFIYLFFILGSQPDFSADVRRFNGILH